MLFVDTNEVSNVLLHSTALMDTDTNILSAILFYCYLLLLLLSPLSLVLLLSLIDCLLYYCSCFCFYNL